MTGQANCPYDWVSCLPTNEPSPPQIRLYDGVDEFSPLIGHFCGSGSFPRSRTHLDALLVTRVCPRPVESSVHHPILPSSETTAGR